MIAAWLMLLGAALAAGCAPRQIGGERAPRVIAVSGVGRVLVKPDTALATVGAEARAALLADATADVSRRMTLVLARVKALGVDEKDISTVVYSIDPLPAPRRTEDDPARVAGYRVVNLVQLRIRDLDAVGRVLDAAVTAGANSVTSLQFILYDRTRVEAEARALAVRAAAEKAQQLADAAGVRLGEVLSLNEGAPRPVVERFGRAAIAAVAAPGPVEPGQLEITVAVEAQYRLDR